MEEGVDVSFTKTIDIDGFFVYMKPSDMISCINSGGTIVDAEEVRSKDKLRSFKKVPKDSNAPPFIKIVPVKFAFLDEKNI